ncbi:3-deoxy-7-phosphoheptulonate synthase [soil metagenome]
MLITLPAGIEGADCDDLREQVEGWGIQTRSASSAGRWLLVCIGDGDLLARMPQLGWPRGTTFTAVPQHYALCARGTHSTTRVVIPGPRPIVVGGNELVLAAGPCSVESLESLRDVAYAAGTAGAALLRGGAFKPRTSPYAFCGLGEAALEMLGQIRSETGLAVVSEVLDARQIDAMLPHVDVFQVGARNMQNFTLLAELGRIRRPVLLKRGLAATVEELLMAAEHIVARGNTEVILCERGVRAYETFTRNTLDVGAVAVLKRETHLPVFVDPSHAAGCADLVPALSFAAIAAGCDGLIVEVHADPARALSDGAQSLTPAAFHELTHRLAPIAAAVGRVMPARRQRIHELVA